MLCSIMVSKNLFDASNIIRFVFLSISFAVIFITLLIQHKTLVLPNNFIFVFYSIFVVLYGLTTVYAINFAEAIFDFSKWLLALFCCVFYYNLLKINYIKTLKTTTIAAMSITVILIIIAVIQFCQMDNHSLFNNPAIYNIKGLNVHKNLFSTMLFLLSTFLLSGFIILKNKLKYISGVLLVFCLFLIAILSTRVTLLGLLVAIILGSCLSICHIVLRNKKRKFLLRKKILTSSLLTICVFIFFLIPLKRIVKRTIPYTNTEIDIVNTSSLSERFALWNKSYELIEQSPFLGCGIGNWKFNYPKTSLDGLFRADYLDDQFFRPHNDFISIISEGGWIIFTIYISFICFLIVFSFSKLICIKNKTIFHLFSTLLASFVGMQFIAFFDYPKERIELLVWSNIIIASLIFFIKPANSKEEKSIHPVINLCCALIFTFTSIIGIYRFYGEYQISYMQRFVNNNNWEQIGRYSYKAKSIFYNYTPTGFPIDFYIGQACSRQDRQATYYFREALKIAPYHKQTLNESGRDEYFCQHDYFKAVSSLEEAIKISPNYAYPYFNLATIYLAEHQEEKAEYILDKLNLDYKEKALLDNADKYSISKNQIGNLVNNIKTENDIKQNMLKQIYKNFIIAD